jgi:hypothetical protein
MLTFLLIILLLKINKNIKTVNSKLKAVYCLENKTNPKGNVLVVKCIERAFVLKIKLFFK